MNEAFPDTLYNGILLCIYIQLILIGFLNLFKKNKRMILLGTFCIIIGTGYIYNIYWNSFKNNIIYSILLANQKNLYYGPLLYLYFALLKKNSHNKKSRNHLILPTLIFICYTLIKHFFTSYLVVAVHFSYVMGFLLALFYLILGFTLFKNLKNILKPQLITKYRLFYFGFLFYILGMNVHSLIILFFDIRIEISDFVIWNRYFLMPLGLIINIGVLVFVLSESPRLKSFIQGKTIYINDDIVDGKTIIAQRIQIHFYDNKLFKNTGLKIKDVATKIGLSEKGLAEYLKNEYNMSFTDFINTLRIKEFKLLLHDSTSNQYSLFGLAEKSGFKSKATFYRVFKYKEGITPNEYLKSL